MKWPLSIKNKSSLFSILWHSCI